MYYPDLSYYRDGEPNGIANMYPELRNIGWLGKSYSFSQGNVSASLTQKLKEMLFLDLKNTEERQRDIFDKNKAVLIHQMHMRGSPYGCPFCPKEHAIINVEPINLQYYLGNKEMLLGINEISIPSLNRDEFYSFPSMIYHYITEHKYKPPQEFLDALTEFNLDKPCDMDEAQSDLICIEMPMNEVNDYEHGDNP
jgi:hypothetical protein